MSDNNRGFVAVLLFPLVFALLLYGNSRVKVKKQTSASYPANCCVCRIDFLSVPLRQCILGLNKFLVCYNQAANRLPEFLTCLMNTARNLLLFILLLNVAVLDIAIIWHFAFNWEGSYNDEQAVLIDAVSAQLSIFEALLAAGGIALTLLGFWGYKDIRDFVAEEIKKSVDISVVKTVNESLDERGYKEKPEAAIMSPAMKIADKTEKGEKDV